MHTRSFAAVVAVLSLALLVQAHADGAAGGQLQHKRMVIKARQDNGSAASSATLALTRNGGSAAAAASSTSSEQQQQQQQPTRNSVATSTGNNGQQPATSQTNVAATNNNNNESANDPASSSTTGGGGGGLLDSINSGLSSALIGPSSSTALDTALSSSTAASSTALAQTTSSIATSAPASSAAPATSATQVSDPLVDNLTLTSTISAPVAASSTVDANAAQETQEPEKKESSGIGKTTVIIIIVVASVVGGAIAIWTIIRKVVFSPSSRFNRKLAPVDFDAARRDSMMIDYSAGAGVGLSNEYGSSASLVKQSGTSDAWPLHRSGSQSSNGHGGPDAAGRYSPDNIGGRPNMSENGHGAFYPALPPTTAAAVPGLPPLPMMETQSGYHMQGYAGGQQQDYYANQQGGLGYGGPGSMRRPNW